jgi:glycosyltransferase involved in cell wall biosynthesis
VVTQTYKNVDNVAWEKTPLAGMASRSKPKVLFVGTVDVDLRLDLMKRLECDFDISAAGSNPDLADRFHAAGFKYHIYSLNRRVNPAMDLYSMSQLVSLFRKEKPDIVHTFSAKPCALARQAARLARVPVVIGTLTGLSSLYASETFSVRLVRSIYEPLQKVACYLSELTIFQNHDDWNNYTGIGIVSKEKSVVIPGSGVPVDKFNPAAISPKDKQNLRSELGIKPDEFVVTLVTRVIRTKGVIEFMEAAKIMKEHFPKVRFLLVGPNDTDTMNSLNPDEISELERSVIWPGPRRDIPMVLAISDLFAYPSTHMEGIPRVLLEAASMGLPIITTDSPGCNDVVQPGVNGFFVPAEEPEMLSDLIAKLIAQPELRNQFAKASRQCAVERFDLSIIAEQICDIYMHHLAHKNQVAVAPSI